MLAEVFLDSTYMVVQTHQNNFLIGAILHWCQAIRITPHIDTPHLDGIISLILSQILLSPDLTDFAQKIAGELGISLNQIHFLHQFLLWLKEPATGYDQVHNHIRFILAWNKVYGGISVL